MFPFLALVLVLFFGSFAQAQAPGNSPPVREQELFSMVRSRAIFPDDQIIEVIASRGIGFRLTDSIRRELKKQGASARVMEALEKAFDKLKRQTTAEAVAAAKAALPPLVPPPPTPPTEEQLKIIEEVRENALAYTNNLPNFICLQVTRRLVQLRPDDNWHTQDVIQARLAYNEKKENYQLVSINDRITDRPYESLGGATSTGEFGSLLHGIFREESQARFTWVGTGTLRGRPVYEYDYAVDKERSRWSIIWQKADMIVPAYRGHIWVDAETKQVLRLTMEAVDIPREFPINEARTALDYDYAKISGRPYLLPLLAQVDMREGKISTRNEIQFRQYRRFTADTKLVFEEEPEEKTEKPQPPKP